MHNMSVIVELRLPSDQFELGRILAMEERMSISLETMVPIGDRPIPFFRLRDGARDSFQQQVSENPTVNDIHVVNATDEQVLYALDWASAEDKFIDGIRSMDGYVLEATGSEGTWAFELRFPSHDSLAGFREHCSEAGFPIDIQRIYNPTKPEAGPWFGLTVAQREALMRAVEAGYYSIPRRCSTQDLADEFGISDQAVTERLRRAIHTLVDNTLLISDQVDR